MARFRFPSFAFSSYFPFDFFISSGGVDRAEMKLIKQLILARLRQHSNHTGLRKCIQTP
jgi:hypothetical protein